MAYVDWKIASLCVMLLVGLFNVLARKFFAMGEDWRLLLLPAVIGGVVLIAYFATTYREIRFTESGLVFMVAMGIIVAISTLLTAAVYADGSAPLSVAMPIMGMSIVVTAVAAAVFLHEPFTPLKVVGILLGAVSIFLLLL